FDPENADVGRVVAALVKDPVVIIAEDAKQEELLLRYGFSGPGRYIVRLDLYPEVRVDREAVLRIYPELKSFSPRIYRASERGNLPAWLGGILERYNIPESILSLDQARRIVESLEALRAA
ncbi:MAG: hypothetical protein HYZ93_04575, partial [Candidatus Omnitrophica bacterium]|nr:hypothetical protein [Candidatus Omnitrophota bacterium]